MNIADILENHTLADWEETSLAYCNLMLIKQGGGGSAVVLCNDDEWEQSAVKRTLSGYQVRIESIYTRSMIESGQCTLEQIACTPAHMIIVSTLDISNLIKHRGRLHRIVDKYFVKNASAEAAKNLMKRVLMLRFPYWRIRREEIFLYAKEHTQELQALANELGDEASRETLCEIIRCSAENDFFRMPEGRQDEKYWDCYRHLDNEVWVNCGSAVGDTVLKYLSRGYRFDKIYAYEGSQSEFAGLQQIISKLPAETQSKIERKNCFIGLEQSEENFDHFFENVPVTLINMDIEGAEMGVLRGAEQLIRTNRPVLAVCAYHKATDLLDIPNFIKGAADDYVVFMRKYRGFELNALNEYVYYLVPKERVQ